jgi:hypothetical protein
MNNTPIRAAWVSLVASSFVAILLTFTLFSANAAESGDEQESKTEELAKETQNLVANLISVQFQNNFNFGIGPNDAAVRGSSSQEGAPAMVWIPGGTFLMGTNDKESFLVLKCTFSLPNLGAIKLIQRWPAEISGGRMSAETPQRRRPTR